MCLKQSTYIADVDVWRVCRDARDQRATDSRNELKFANGRLWCRRRGAGLADAGECRWSGAFAHLAGILVIEQLVAEIHCQIAKGTRRRRLQSSPGSGSPGDESSAAVDVGCIRSVKSCPSRSPCCMKTHQQIISLRLIQLSENNFIPTILSAVEIGCFSAQKSRPCCKGTKI